MTIQQHQQELANIHFAYPELAHHAHQINQYTEMCKQGQISTAEYVELVEDIQRSINIQNYVHDIDNLQKLNTAINGLITIAKLA